MPTYVYRREDGSTFEMEQRITADPLEVCPETGQKVERVITGAGLIFKGSGFYLTDYARKKETAASTADPKDSKESKDSKPAAKTSEKGSTSENTSSSNGKSESSSKSASSE